MTRSQTATKEVPEHRLNTRRMILDAIKEAKINRADLAKAVGIGRVNLSRTINGHARITARVAVGLELTLKQRPGWAQVLLLGDLEADVTEARVEFAEKFSTHE